jgi:hypothetical protein
MVLQGEGRGKFSSPHSVKLLGTKSLSKWGGMIRIGSLYYLSSISMLSKWKKLEESSCRSILETRSDLKNWVQKNYLKSPKAILRHQMTFFGVQTYNTTRLYILHTETFPLVQESPQLEFVCESYASRKLTYRVNHHGTSGCHVNPRYSKCVELAM